MYSLPFRPTKGEAFRLFFDSFPTGATSMPASDFTAVTFSISKDGGAMASTTNAGVNIASGTNQNRGRGYIDLTSTEMNADVIIVAIPSSGTNSNPYSVVIYTTTEEDGGSGGGGITLDTELTDDGVLSGNGTVGDVLKALFYFLKKNRNRKTITR